MNVLWRINALFIIKHVLLIVTNPPHTEGRERHTYHCMENRYDIGAILSFFIGLDVSLIEAKEQEMANHVQYCEV